MDSLYSAGIKGKLYRLWYEMNSSNNIFIKNGAGKSKAKETTEYIGQGTIGGALLSSLNLDMRIQEFFKQSTNEISYSDIKLGPLIFQDDLARMTSSVHDAQAGNDKVACVTNLKQLEVNIDKS